MKEKLKDHDFNPKDKKDFKIKVKAPNLFSAQDYFNTVFLSGEAIIKQEAQDRK